MAHRPASSKVIEAGDVVQVHVAPIVDGYYVDLCRTLFVGGVPAEARDALDAYLGAQEAGIAAATPGAPLMGIDTAMAEALAARGYQNAFLRPVFHGVGMEHEEAPIPGGHAVIHGEEKVDNVEPGMVLGIGNCGIYPRNVRCTSRRHRLGKLQRPATTTRHPTRSPAYRGRGHVHERRIYRAAALPRCRSWVSDDRRGAKPRAQGNVGPWPMPSLSLACSQSWPSVQSILH